MTITSTRTLFSAGFYMAGSHYIKEVKGERDYRKVTR